MPSNNVTIVDLNVGRTAPVSTVPAVAGVCSSGTPGTVYRFTKVNDVNTTLGYGPAVTAAQRVIAEAGIAVDVCPCTAATAATGSAVTKTGSGASLFLSPTVPYDRYDGIVEITTTGVPGTGFFRTSFDGGESYTAPTVIPTSLTKLYDTKNVTLKFINLTSSYIAGDTYRFTTTPPVPNASGLNIALAGLRSANGSPNMILVAADITTGSQGAALGAQVDATEIPAFFNVKQNTQFMMFAGSGSVSEIVPAWSTVEDKMLATTIGYCRMSHPRPESGYSNPLVPVAYPIFAEACRIAPQTGFDAVHLGSLSGVSDATIDDYQLGGDDGTWLPHKFIALRTFPGSAALYPMSSVMKSPAGSDFQFWEYSRLINIAKTAQERFLQRYLNSSVKVKTTDGTIDEKAAGKIEGDGVRVISAVLDNLVDERGEKGAVSGFTFTVDRTNNLQLTNELITTLRIVMLGKIVDITSTIGIAASL